MEIDTSAELRAAPNSTLTAEIDRQFKNFASPGATGSWDRRAAAALTVQPYLQELARRDQHKQTEAMLRMTATMTCCTKWIVGMTVATLLMTAVQVVLAIRTALHH